MALAWVERTLNREKNTVRPTEKTSEGGEGGRGGGEVDCLPFFTTSL